MSQGSNGLHLNGVPLFQGMVKDAGCVNNLPTQVLVVGMTHVQGLGSEGIGLDFNIGSGDFVDEAGLAHVGEAADEQGPGVGVNGWQTAQMLTNLIKLRRLVKTSTNECAGFFKLLALF